MAKLEDLGTVIETDVLVKRKPLEKSAKQN